MTSHRWKRFIPNKRVSLSFTGEKPEGVLGGRVQSSARRRTTQDKEQLTRKPSKEGIVIGKHILYVFLSIILQQLKRDKR